MRVFPRITLVVLAIIAMSGSASFAAPDTKAQASKHFAAAASLQKSGRLEKAVQEYQAGLKLDPKSVPALTNLSIIYVQRRQFANAEAAYKRILAIQPKNEAIMDQLARVLLDQRKPQEALPLINKLVDLKPSDRGRKELLAAANMANQDYAAAANVWRILIHKDPRDQEAYANLAGCYMAMQRYDDVLQTMQQLLEINPSSPKGNMTAAYAAEKLGNKALAVKFYEAAGNGPAASSALLNAARLYQVMKQPEKGVAALQKLLKVDKDNYDALFNLGAYEYGKRNWTKAISYWTAAKRVKPKDFAVNLNLGMAQARVSKFKEALSGTTMAVSLRPKDVAALEGHAYVLECLGERDKAIQVYKRWGQYYPKDPAPNQKLGILYFGKGDKKSAYAQFDVALKKAPKSLDVLSIYGDALSADNQFAKAYTYYEKALDVDPKSVQTMLRASWCLQQDKKFPETIALLTKAIGVDPDNKEPRARLANVYREQKQPQLAIAQYRKLVEMDPKDTITAIQLAQLYTETSDHAAAAGVYRRLLESPEGKDNRFYRDMLAGSLEKSGDYASALEQYAELAKADDPSVKADALAKTAAILDKQGKPEEAIASYKQSLDLQPNEMTFTDLGTLYETQKKTDEFHGYLKTVIETCTKNPPYKYIVGVLRSAGKADEAMKALETAAQAYPDSVQLSLVLASELAASGQSGKAVECYKSVLAKFPSEPTAHKELGRLLIKTGQKEEGVEHLATAATHLSMDAPLLRELADLYYGMPNKRSEALKAYRDYSKLDPANQEVKLRITELETPAPGTPEPQAPAISPAP